MKAAENLVVFVMVLQMVWRNAGGAAPSIGEQCGNEYQKVTTCLTFATGKQDSPSGDCCTSVTDIKEKDPVCLCYIIQQLHSGSNSQLKNMGIQEARLLLLPSACKLHNASSAECPKLLNLPPNSPDAAIFTNASASESPSSTTVAPAPPGTSSSPEYEVAHGFKNQPQVAGPVAIAVAIFFCAFPRGRI